MVSIHYKECLRMINEGRASEKCRFLVVRGELCQFLSSKSVSRSPNQRSILYVHTTIYVYINGPNAFSLYLVVMEYFPR